MTDQDKYLCAALAHSAVYFSRQEWLPVQDATCGIFGLDSDSTNETVDQQQVAAEGGGTGSATLVSGAESSPDYVTDGTVLRGDTISTAAGATTDISISNPDPAAIAAVQSTSEDAIDDVSSVAALGFNDVDSIAGESESDLAYTAQEAIGSSNNAVNQLSATAQGALNVVGTNSTLLESIAGEYEAGLEQATAASQTTANNAVTGEDEGISEQQLPNAVVDETATEDGGSTSLQKLALYLTIAGGIIALYLFLKKGK